MSNRKKKKTIQKETVLQSSLKKGSSKKRRNLKTKDVEPFSFLLYPGTGLEDIKEYTNDVLNPKIIFERWYALWIYAEWLPSQKIPTPPPIKIPSMDDIPIQETNDTSFDFKTLPLLNSEYRLQLSWNRKFTIKPLRKFNSCRFTRFFGNEMFLFISFKEAGGCFKEKKQPDFQFFPPQLDFSLLGLGQWEYFYFKAKSVVYIRIDKKFKGKYLCAGIARDWMLDRNFNHSLTLAKYNARMALGFSTTIVLDKALREDEFEVIEDIYHGDTEESIMTDGCGLISYSLMEEVRITLQLQDVPFAIQARFGSCKGIWCLADDQYMKGKKLICRESQRKYFFGGNRDSVHRKLELNSTVRPHTARLNELIILFLQILDDGPKRSKNGVKKHILALLHEEKARYDSMFASLQVCLDAVRQSSDVVAEDIFQMIVAGFTLEHNLLHSTLEQFSKRNLEKAVSLGKIEVEKGAVLVMIPDHTGMLAEGEVFIRFSDFGQFNEAVLEGSVLVFRVPLQLLSDVAVMKAVDYPELHSFSDCIVFSTKGTISPASILAGGDYDGDKAWVFWDERLISIQQRTKLEIPATFHQHVQPHTRGLQRKLHLLSPKKLNNELLLYAMEQTYQAGLGLYTNLLKEKVFQLANASSAIDTEKLKKEVHKLGYLCSQSVDAAKAGVLVSFPENKFFPRKQKKLNFLQDFNISAVPVEQRMDNDLVLPGTPPEIIVEMANSIFSRLKRRNQKVEVTKQIKDEIQHDERCMDLVSRLQLASYVYCLYNGQENRKCVYMFQLKMLFLSEFCVLKANAVSLRDEQSISHSMLLM